MNDLNRQSQASRPDEGARGEDFPPPIRSTTIILMVAGAATFAYMLSSILLPFVLAGTVAYVFTPLITWAAEATRLPRWWFALAVLLALMGLGAALGYLGLPSLLSEVMAIGGDLRGTIETLARKLIGDSSFHLAGETIDASSLADYAVNGLRDWFGANGRVFQLATIGFAGFFGFILSWVLLGYFLFDGPRVGRGIFWLVPPRRRPAAAQLWARLDPVLRRYFIGIALVVVYASVAAYIGLGLFLGLRHAVVLALLTGVLEIIPLVGPAASAIIAGLAAVEEAKSAWDILTYIVYATALRISIDQLVGPIVLGRAAYVRPVVVIFCFLAGAVLFGIVGMILGVPAALAIKVMLSFSYQKQEEEG